MPNDAIEKPLSIKNKRTCRLVRELSKLTGNSITKTIEDALMEKQKRLKNNVSDDAGSVIDRACQIANDYSELPLLDDRNADQILGYNPLGTLQRDLK